MIVILCSLSAFLGYKFGFRETYNSDKDNISYVDPKVSVRNSLTEISIRPILGPKGTTQKLEENKSLHRGYVLYKNNGEETEIRIMAADIPMSINIPEDKKNNKPALNVDIPKSLRVEMAKPNPVTDNFDFEVLGQLNLNPPQNNFYTAELNKSIPNTDKKSLTDYDLLLFYDAEDKVTNIYEFSIEGYANIPTEKRKPFFWVYISKSPIPGT